MQSRNTMPYFPQYAVVFKGKDSPGMGVYNPNDSLVKESMPEYALQEQDRFIGDSLAHKEIKK